LADDFNPQAVFARSFGFSLGKAEPTVESLRAVSGGREFVEAHVAVRGERPSELVATAVALLREAHGLQSVGLGEPTIAARLVRDPSNQTLNQLALDCILVEPDQWWLGYHRATNIVTSWPGGWFCEPLPAHAVSRAYLKMAEALAWSQFPLKAGEQVAE